MPAQVTLPVMGHVEYFGIAFEATYGTAVQPNIFFRPASNTLRALPVTESLAGPGGMFGRFKYETDPAIPRHLRLPSDRSGQVVLELDYDDVGHILTNLIKQPTVAAFQGTGFQHIWNLAPSAAPIPTLGPPSMTCTRNTGLQNKDYRIGGCMINKAVFRGQAGQLVTVALDIVGATGGEPAAAIGANYNAPAVGTLSLDPFIEFFHSDVSVSTDLAAGNMFSYSGSGADVSDWTLTYDNQYDISPSAGGGNLGIRQPTWQSAPLITMEWTHRWTPTNAGHPFLEFDFMHPTSELNRYHFVRIGMTHPTQDVGAGPVNKTLRFDFPAGIFLGDPPVYDGGSGFITQTCRVEAAGGGSELNGAVFQATILNNTSTYIVT